MTLGNSLMRRSAERETAVNTDHLPPEIKLLKNDGHEVEKLTPYQYRIDRTLDLYPKRRKFHNIATQSRGQYPLREDELRQFVASQVGEKKSEQPLASGRHYRESMAPWWAKVGKRDPEI
jgi:hypothetical protein